MQIINSKLNTFSCILTKLYGIYMIQKYKKKPNTQIYQCLNAIYLVFLTIKLCVFGY